MEDRVFQPPAYQPLVTPVAQDTPVPPRLVVMIIEHPVGPIEETAAY